MHQRRVYPLPVIVKTPLSRLQAPGKPSQPAAKKTKIRNLLAPIATTTTIQIGLVGDMKASVESVKPYLNMRTKVCDVSCKHDSMSGRACPNCSDQPRTTQAKSSASNVSLHLSSGPAISLRAVTAAAQIGLQRADCIGVVRLKRL